MLSPKRTRGALSIDEASGIASEQPAPVQLSWKIKLTAVCVAGLLTIFCGNWINSHVAPQKALVGIILVGVVAIIGDFLACNIPYKVPAVCWVSAVGMLATAPIGPWAAPVAAITSSVNFMPLTTPILAYAGLSLAKDIPAFKRLGWRIVVTSLLANTGTFIAAATLAHFLMHV